MHNTTVRIASKLYFDLWKKGNSVAGLSGDKLIAVYCMLKHHRNNKIKYFAHKANNNKTVSDYALLRKQTPLSLSVLKKYVPVLIDMGLCHFDNGDFVLLGGEKTKELYNSYKLVPVKIGENLSTTICYVMGVRIFAEHKEQTAQIKRKKHRSELLRQGVNPKNLKQYKSAQKVLKKYGKETIIDKVILSNEGYALLKDETRDNKSKGQYWKKKLINSNIIKTERRYLPLQEVPYSELLNNKYYNKYVYRRGWVCEELISSFSPILP